MNCNRQTLRRRVGALVMALIVAPLMFACTGIESNTPPPKELQMIDHKIGDGDVATPGHLVTVHYTGWLYDASAHDHKGKKFDSSVDRGQPFPFQLGAGQVIKGWDEGVAGMKVGGQRTLVIPPEKAYGEREVGGVIPANSTLVFDVELLGVR